MHTHHVTTAAVLGLLQALHCLALPAGQARLERLYSLLIASD
jgi:hypothetical protein